MARHKKFLVDEEKEPELDISSMIDMCFLLLIYFLVTMTIAPPESDLGMALPSSTQTDEARPPLEPLFIKVEANGAIYTGVGSSQMPMDTDPDDRTIPLLTTQLRGYADTAKAAGEIPLVQIWVDGGATQQRVVDVLNALSGVGITSVTFTDLLDS
jgi:biopolymer transport protein ExbD